MSTTNESPSVTELIARLRWLAGFGAIYQDEDQFGDTLADAAAALEALEAQLDAMRAAMMTDERWDVALTATNERMEALEAENARLRAAGDKLADAISSPIRPNPKAALDAWREARGQ